MRFYRIPAVLLAFCAATSLLSGCTAGRQNNAGIGGQTITLTANSFRYPLHSEPVSYDPAKVEDGMTIDLLQQVFEGLVQWDDNNKIAPNLASKWTLSPDGKTYTFTLRKGIKFHNGREMKADDVKYSIERVCAKETASPTAATYLKDIVGVSDKLAGKANDISGIKVVDPYTIAITIDSFKPYWLGNLTYPTAYVVCKEAIEQNGNILNEKSCVGTGPYKLAEVRQGYQVILSAFDGYHEGRPKLDFIVRPILKDANTRLSKYEADELDLAVISPRDLNRINSEPKLKSELHSFARAAIWYIALNQTPADSPFRKKEVRQAFAHAVNVKEVIRVALKDQADPANGIVPIGIPGHNPKSKLLAYNPALAKQLLAQAGYPDGKGFPTLAFSFRQDEPEVGEAAQVIANQLKTNLGVDLQLRPMEWGQFLSERLKKTMPIYFFRWSADYLDPQDFLSVMLHTNRQVNGQDDHPENGVGYSNSEFDRLCDLADVEHDSKKRMDYYNQAEQIAIDDAPWAPIYFQRDLELIKPRVKGLRHSLFGHLPHIRTSVLP